MVVLGALSGTDADTTGPAAVDLADARRVALFPSAGCVEGDALRAPELGVASRALEAGVVVGAVASGVASNHDGSVWFSETLMCARSRALALPLTCSCAPIGACSDWV